MQDWEYKCCICGKDTSKLIKKQYDFWSNIYCSDNCWNKRQRILNDINKVKEAIQRMFPLKKM